MTDKLLEQINYLDEKMANEQIDIDENKKKFKSQLKSPIVMPLILLSSVAIGFLIIRKKKHNHFFAYLSSLSLAAAGIYKNIKFVMTAINQFTSPTVHKIPGKEDTTLTPREYEGK